MPLPPILSSVPAQLEMAPTLPRFPSSAGPVRNSAGTCTRKSWIICNMGDHPQVHQYLDWNAMFQAIVRLDLGAKADEEGHDASSSETPGVTWHMCTARKCTSYCLLQVPTLLEVMPNPPGLCGRQYYRLLSFTSHILPPAWRGAQRACKPARDAKDAVSHAKFWSSFCQHADQHSDGLPAQQANAVSP